jgi:hypothetical protein
VHDAPPRGAGAVSVPFGARGRTVAQTQPRRRGEPAEGEDAVDVFEAVEAPRRTRRQVAPVVQRRDQHARHDVLHLVAEPSAADLVPRGRHDHARVGVLHQEVGVARRRASAARGVAHVLNRIRSAGRGPGGIALLGRGPRQSARLARSAMLVYKEPIFGSTQRRKKCYDTCSVRRTARVHARSPAIHLSNCGGL